MILTSDSTATTSSLDLWDSSDTGNSYYDPPHYRYWWEDMLSPSDSDFHPFTFRKWIGTDRIREAFEAKAQHAIRCLCSIFRAAFVRKAPPSKSGFIGRALKRRKGR